MLPALPAPLLKPGVSVLVWNQRREHCCHLQAPEKKEEAEQNQMAPTKAVMNKLTCCLPTMSLLKIETDGIKSSRS